MSDKCPLCGGDYTDYFHDFSGYSSWYTEGVREVRVCPKGEKVFVHLYELKHRLKFLLTDENPRRNFIEITEHVEVR